MHETLAREHAHLPGFPMGSGMFDWRSDLGLALAYKHVVDLLWEGPTIVDNSLIRSLTLVCVGIWPRMLYGSFGPLGRGMSTVIRLDWLASRVIVIRRLGVDLSGACLAVWCERSAAGAVDPGLLTIPELYLASLEGLPEISNSAVSCLDQ